ncbi:skin secretory protein xP2 [Nasonia vitripennis]|uniref:Uncharacterized protein n=1 Tax=Nasonia vitripennis TaxID=7425 RepID=A0A7M7Q1Y7_NASVI|nr:skin secretory protein xP2 [Nasonia vitripennis]
MFLLLALSSWLVASAQASIWPYHGSAAPGSTGAVIVDAGIGSYDYGSAYGIEPQLTLGHANGYGAVIGSGAANSILVKGPKVIVGPGEGPVLVQGPRQSSATIVGPSEGPATIVGPSSGAATIVGPSSGAATIVGPTAGGATIVGPSEGGATIVGPTAGAATIVGPSEGGATIVGPQQAPATIIGPSTRPVAIVGSSRHDGYAHAHAEAHAEAHAHTHANNWVWSQPPIIVKERPTIIREDVHYHHEHHPVVVKQPVYDNHVVCAPAVAGWDTNAAVKAVAHAASHYGPVHVGTAHGRPVVTVSGPLSVHGHGHEHNHVHVESLPRPVAALSGPVAPIAVITGPSGSISTGGSSASSIASAHSSAYAHSNDWAVKKYWYPSPTWRKC